MGMFGYWLMMPVYGTGMARSTDVIWDWRLGAAAFKPSRPLKTERPQRKSNAFVADVPTNDFWDGTGDGGNVLIRE
jgi:hypothetical protein